jgi:molecular chaperone GrpE
MMTSDDHANDNPCQPAEAGDADADAPADTDSPWSEGTAAELQAENSDLKDRVLRALAELENLRRRAEREREETRKYAITAFARDMLNVGDNMTRALQSLDDAAREQAQDTVKALIEGVDITHRELMKVFQRHGIEQLKPEGEKFDPNFHQAMFEVEDPKVAAGTVIQVVQDGYRIGERVLRPALVGVSKGGPRTAPGAPEPKGDAEGQEPADGDDSRVSEAKAAARSHEEAASAKAAAEKGKAVDRNA